MKSRILLIYFFVALMMFPAVSQTTTVSESRKESLMSILNYRYKGGFYTLEKDFNNTVKYPDIARINCRLGICVASVVVDCKGVIQEVTIKNPLKLGIDEEVSNFFNSTAGKWNSCEDDKYTRFDIPIQFVVDETETNTDVALLICVGERLEGQPCNSDEYYLKKAKKFLEKKNGKKAIQNIDMLIRRDPFNNDYYEMKKEALEYL